MSEPNVHEQLAGMTIERDAALAELAALRSVLVTEWSETLENDGVYEYTITADCDGSNAQRLRRSPRLVRRWGYWEKVPE